MSLRERIKLEELEGNTLLSTHNWFVKKETCVAGDEESALMGVDEEEKDQD